MNDLDLLRASGDEYARSGPKLVRAAEAQRGVELRPFELKDKLTPGETVTAYRLDEDGEPITAIEADPEAEPPVEGRDEQTFEVTDTWACYRGRARVEHVDADPEAEPPVEEVPGYSGSRGVARKNEAGDWVIGYLDPNALLIRGQAAADVAGSSASFHIDTIKIVSPTGARIVDQEPPLEDADTMDVFDPAKKSWLEDDELDCQWNEDAARWEVLDSSAAKIAYGKIQTNPVTNQSGATHLTVSVKACDLGGNNESTAAAFDVQTPIDAKRRTALAYGDVVGYVIDAAGNKIIVTDCWNHYIMNVSVETIDASCGLKIDDGGDAQTIQSAITSVAWQGGEKPLTIISTGFASNE